MDGNMNLFARQKGRQRGNNMLPIAHGGTGSRAERRKVERERAKQIKRQMKQEAREQEAQAEQGANRETDKAD